MQIYLEAPREVPKDINAAEREAWKTGTFGCSGDQMLRLLFVAVAVLGLASPAFAAKSSLFDGLLPKLGSSSFGGKPTVRTGQLRITIDIATQEMTVTDGRRTIYTFDVSTGRPGYSTPTGTYRPIRMHEMWYSSKYENSPMPYSIFFKGGYAIHGTGDLKNLGRVASHGCVRLDPKNAKLLFDLVNEVGMKNTTIALVRS